MLASRGVRAFRLLKPIAPLTFRPQVWTVSRNFHNSVISLSEEKSGSASWFSRKTEEPAPAAEETPVAAATNEEEEEEEEYEYEEEEEEEEEEEPEPEYVPMKEFDIDAEPIRIVQELQRLVPTKKYDAWGELGDAALKLFLLAEKFGGKDLVIQTQEDLKTVAEFMHDVPEIYCLVHTPSAAINEDDREKSMNTIFKSMGVHNVTSVWCQAMFAGGKYEKFGLLQEAFDAIVEKEYNQITTVVSTAQELTADQYKRLEDKLKAMNPGIAINPVYEIDPELLGGMTIRMGDKFWDCSLASQVTEIHESLQKVM
jgi:F-type H+-transporting ATPase subunit delta